MDQQKPHKTKISSLTQIVKAHNCYVIVNLTIVLVSVYLFSLIFPQISLLSFIHHFNFYFSTFSQQIFSHTMDKNCMFLLCNGLLVFVGITRSLSGYYSGFDEVSNYADEESSQSRYSDAEPTEPMLVEEKTITECHEHNNEAEKEVEIKCSVKEIEEEEEEENIESTVLEDDDDDDDEEEEEGKGSGVSNLKEEVEQNDEIELFDEEEEEEEKESETDEFQVVESVEEENLVTSTEELNKKFDEFIRRMKEDLRIEARRRLVMV